MRYLVKVNNIKEKVIYFETELDVIEENINNIESLKKIVIWEGEGADSYLENLDLYVAKLRTIEKNIFASITYLNSFYDTYGEEYNRLKNKYSHILEEEI